MVSIDKPSNIVGLWRGASRATQICPYCPRIVTEHSPEDFRLMLGRGSSDDYRPICPMCYQVCFVYFEHPGEREWTHEGSRHSFRFVGWEHPIFLQKMAGLFDSNTVAYRNIKSLIETGF